MRRDPSHHRPDRCEPTRRHRADRSHAQGVRRHCRGDAPPYPPASLHAELRRVGGGGAGREPYLDPHLAGAWLWRPRHLHVRRCPPRALRQGAEACLSPQGDLGDRASARRRRVAVNDKDSLTRRADGTLWYRETLHEEEGLATEYRISQVLFDSATPHQRLIVVDTDR